MVLRGQNATPKLVAVATDKDYWNIERETRPFVPTPSPEHGSLFRQKILQTSVQTTTEILFYIDLATSGPLPLTLERTRKRSY